MSEELGRGWRWLTRLLARMRRARPPRDATHDAAGPAPLGDEDEAIDEVTALRGDELDLHTFAPKQVASVVAEYVSWAAETKLSRVRIIHGKGAGVLRRIVHAELARHRCVRAYGLCDERSGGWGATWAELTPPGEGG